MNLSVLNHAKPSSNRCLKFSSKIVLVKKSELESIVPALEYLENNDEYSGAPWNVRNSVINKKRAYTSGVRNCNVLGVANEFLITLFHLNPSIYNLGSDMTPIQLALQNALRFMVKEGQKLKGVLIGGWAGNEPHESDSKGVENSTHINYVLKENLSETGINLDQLTRIWGRKVGKKEGDSNIFYIASLDTWYIYCKNDLMPLLTEEDLRSVFEEVHIAPTDQLITINDAERFFLLSRAKSLREEDPVKKKKRRWL